MTEHEKGQIAVLLDGIGEDNAPRTLADFVRGTVAFPLHTWQEFHLCPILERLRHEKGLRILLSAPPQYGKSIVVSQRLPAYILGHDPLHRIGLACYNETHASNFGAVVRDLMASEEYAEMFPDSVISPSDSAGEFSTGPRRSLLDGQPSFKAMGLLSGFVGRGVDSLFVDDPYKSAADAESEAVNTAVWRWWSATARPRIKEETNVIVMYHPYNDNDLAAKLEKEGGWEKHRFPAIADENEDGSDPTGRAIGEVLSPMRSLESLEAERANNPVVFAAQFQGRPAADVGAFFTGTIATVPHPGDIVRAVRAWDIAATEGAGDYTAGVLMAKLQSGRFCILDVILLQAGPDAVDQAILQAAKEDGKGVQIHLAQDPGSAGVRDAQNLAAKLAGYNVKVERVSGSKESRARALAAQVNVGNVTIVEKGRRVTTGPYRGMGTADALRRMMAGFPHSAAKKDGIDAAADAFNAVSGANVGGPATAKRTIDTRAMYAPGLRW